MRGRSLRKGGRGTVESRNHVRRVRRVFRVGEPDTSRVKESRKSGVDFVVEGSLWRFVRGLLILGLGYGI